MNKLSSAILAATLTLTGATVTYAHEAGDIIVRAGIANVDPKDATGNDVDQISSSNVMAETDTQLGLNFVYMLNDNVGVELLAATPFEHDLKVDTGAAGLGVQDLGSTKHLPPTLLVQYYMLDKSSKFRPYLGAGVNYTWFFDESDGDNFDKLDLDDSIGLAFQVGVDVMLTDNLLVNASAYHIDIDTDATVQLDQSLGGTKLTSEVDIDPMVYMVSVGYKL